MAGYEGEDESGPKRQTRKSRTAETASRGLTPMQSVLLPGRALVIAGSGEGRDAGVGDPQRQSPGSEKDAWKKDWAGQSRGTGIRGCSMAYRAAHRIGRRKICLCAYFDGFRELTFRRLFWLNPGDGARERGGQKRARRVVSGAAKLAGSAWMAVWKRVG